MHALFMQARQTLIDDLLNLRLQRGIQSRAVKFTWTCGSVQPYIPREMPRIDNQCWCLDGKRLILDLHKLRIADQTFRVQGFRQTHQRLFKPPWKAERIIRRRRAHQNNQRQHFLMAQGRKIAVEIIPRGLRDTPPVGAVRNLVEIKFQKIGLGDAALQPLRLEPFQPA